MVRIIDFHSKLPNRVLRKPFKAQKVVCSDDDDIEALKDRTAPPTVKRGILSINLCLLLRLISA